MGGLDFPLVVQKETVFNKSATWIINLQQRKSYLGFIVFVTVLFLPSSSPSLPHHRVCVCARAHTCPTPVCIVDVGGG